MKNLGVVITDGVGYRNFIMSDFITEAKENFDNVIIFSCLPAVVYDNLDLNCTVVELDVFQESFVTWFFRKAKEVTHLKLHANDNYGIQDNLHANYSTSRNPRGIATRFIYTWVAKNHSEKWVQRYNRMQQKTFHSHKITKKYKQLLEEHNISILFFTHQRPSYIAPLIYAAEQLKIKTTAFIFSWDNLASKGRMAGDFDYYLVWSDIMKEELLHFYQSIGEHQVSVVGTPQFEPFIIEKFGYDRNALINKFNLDSQKPTILFTCNDSSSKNDPIYLELLAEYIAKDKLVKNVNLIVRTSPAEDSSRFKDISEKFPFVIWNYPDWKVKREGHQEPWTQRVPSFEDLNDLKSLLNHCDLNINVLSTITLDSFVFDKPVINPVFGNIENGMFDDQKFLNYKHLTNLVNSNSTDIVKNKEEYLDAINKVLNNGDDKKAQRESFLNFQIGQPLQGTSERIATILSHWS